MIISFFVGGDPLPKGSMRAFMVRGKPIITNSNRNTKEWQARISAEAQSCAAGTGWVHTDKAVRIVMRFLLQRPKTLPKKVVHNIKRPDLDKLIRAGLDGITGILIEDDSQVVDIRATKQYAQVNEQHGVLIDLEEMP